MPGLKEILNIVNDGSLLNTWHLNAISALESFLSSIKAGVQQQKLPLSPIAISYAKSVSGSDEYETLAQLLASCFSQVGVTVNLCPLVDENTLKSQLNGVGYAIVLCTPHYAAKVGKGSELWNVLDNFGKTKKNALHPLLCEGGFADTALKIVDGHYLIRSFQAVLNKDPLVVFPALVEFVFHLSGSQGLGLLPDILNLKETVNAQAESSYKGSFTQLQLTIQKQTIDYRLKAALEQSAQHHPMKLHIASSPFPVVKERAGVAPIVEGFLPSEAKVGLLFCQNKADTLLTSLHLSEILSNHAERVLTIDCGKYPGQASWDCVRKALKALQLKSADIEAMKQAPLVIVLKGYQDLGAYDNLWVKNALSTWANVKLLVTCQADYFKERGYLRCFLADRSNRRVEDIAVYSIPTFASLEAQMAALSITVTPDVNQDVEQYPISNKRKAEHEELTRFLGRIHQIWVEKDYLKSALHQNPRLFISYAWEEDKTEAGKKALGRQQMYLSRIAQDFKTMGIPTWLDTEQMSGNIDEQMEKNIAESHGVLVIETPRYIERSQQDTNVKKEWDAIYAKSQRQADFRVFPLQYSPHVSQGNPTLTITSFLASHANRCDFTHIDEDYLTRMTHPESGLIARWLCDTPEKKTLYQNAYATFQPELQLLVGKHLIVNQGRNDVLAFDMDNRLKGVIAPFGLTTEDSPMESRFDLVKYFDAFLNNPARKASIVLGRAGSGKSLFALSTFKLLLQPWLNYQNTNNARPQWLPIYIQLRNYAQHPESVIQDALKQQFHLTDKDIATLKQGLNHQQPILFILDGYDELGSGVRPNYTEILKDWPHAKLLITSRPEHFDKDHRPLESLSLKTADGKTLFSSAQEVHVSPFSSNEIEQYIQQYEQGESTNTYQTLKDLPGMMALLDNPFLLTLVLQSLPQLLANRQQVQERNIVRADIYEAFTQTWFLQETQGRELKPEMCNIFSEELAFRLFSAKTIAVSNTSDKKDLWAFLNHPDNQATQEASPLRFSGGEYSFIHKSIYEYFVTKRLLRAIPESDRVIIWQKRLLTEERPIINFMVELYQSLLKPNDNEERLLALVEASKHKDFPINASANAITVLNAARMSFSGRDFSGIRTPGADLSGAICDSTTFEKAYLTNVMFTGAWLHRANFKNALMAGVEFGEYPSISINTYHNHHKAKFKNNFCYSPDGVNIAVQTDNDGDHSIELYTVVTRKLIRKIQRNTPPDFVKFSMDGTLLATNGYRTIDILFTDSGLLHKTLEGRDQGRDVAFSPDGQILASTHHSTINLWSMKHGTLFKSLECASSEHIVFHPNSKLFATANNKFGNCTLELWSIDTGEILKIFGDNDFRECKAIDFSPDGKLLVSGCEVVIIKLWSVESGALFRTLKEHDLGSINSVAFSPDGKLLVSGGDDKTVKLWSEDGALIKTLEGHSNAVLCVRFSPDGKQLASLSEDVLKFWIVNNNVKLKPKNSDNSPIVSVHASPDGKLLASVVRNDVVPDSSHENYIKLWFTSNGLLHKMLPGHTNNNCVHFSPNGQLLVAASKIVKLWSVNNGKFLRILGEHTDWIRSIAFSPDGKSLVSSSDNMLKIWSVENGNLLKTLNTHHTSYVDFIPDGKFIISYGDQKTLKLWSVEGEKLLQEIKDCYAHRDIKFNFSPNGNFLAWGIRKIVSLWDIKNGILLKTLKELSYVHIIKFSHDDKLLATTSGFSPSENITIWSVENGTKLKTLTQPNTFSSVHGLSDKTHILFSPDRKVLIFYKNDEIGLWNISNLEKGLVENLFTFGKKVDYYITPVSSIINSLLTHQNEKGVFLVSGHADHAVRYWQLIEKNNQPCLQLLWSSYQNSLLLHDTYIDESQGHSQNNLDLLLQRGAIGKPFMLSDAGKNASEASINRNNGESSRMGATGNNDNRNDNNERNDCCIS